MGVILGASTTYRMALRHYTARKALMFTLVPAKNEQSKATP